MEELCKQLEFYFSDANLNHSQFMIKCMNTGRQYIDISVIQTFNRVSGHSVEEIQEAVKGSSVLELSPDMLKVKRKSPFKPLSRSEIDRRTIYVDQLPRNVEHDQLKAAFAPYGQVDYISLPKRKILKGTEEVMVTKGFGFVEFSSSSEAKAALEMDGKVLNGSELTVIPKSEWLVSYTQNSTDKKPHHKDKKEEKRQNQYVEQHQNVRNRQAQPKSTSQFISAAIVKIEGVDCSKADLIQQIKEHCGDFRLDLINGQTNGHIRLSSTETAHQLVNSLKEKYQLSFLSEEEQKLHFDFLKEKRKPKQTTESNLVAPEDKLNIEKETYNKKYPKQKTNKKKDTKPNHIIFSELGDDETDNPVTSNLLDDLDNPQKPSETQQPQTHSQNEPQTQDQPQQTPQPQTQDQLQPQTQTPVDKKRKRDKEHKKKKTKKQKKT